VKPLKEVTLSNAANITGIKIKIIKLSRKGTKNR